MIFLSSFLRERRNDFNSQSTDPHPMLCRHTFGQQRALPTYRCSRGNQPGPASSSHYITRQTISQALHPAHGPGRPWGSPVLRWRLGRAGSTAVSVRILKGFYFVGVKKSPQRRRSRPPPLPTCNFCGFFTLLRTQFYEFYIQANAARPLPANKHLLGRPSAPVAPAPAGGGAGPGSCPSSAATPWRPSVTATPPRPALTACLAPPSCPGSRWAQPPAAPRPQIPPVSAAFHFPLSGRSRRADLVFCSRRVAGSEREGTEVGDEFCNSGMASGENAAADRQRSAAICSARPRAPPPPAGGCCGTGVPVRRRGGAGLKGERRI